MQLILSLPLLLLFLTQLPLVSNYEYSISILSKGTKPALSIANPVGQGHSPCKFTFNPGWVPVQEGKDPSKSLLIVRAALCPDNFGGGGDHLMMATCYSDGHCDDLIPIILDLEKSAEDPRVTFWMGWYYLFYYANGIGENTVYLRKTQTPENPNSWQKVGNYGWHRNGCMLFRSELPHYCIFGEGTLGMATTKDMETFNVINTTFLRPNGAQNTKEPEIVVEASTPMVQLSSGDYLHIYSAGTPGWVANGNYTGGWVILDSKDPNVIVQRSTEHLFVPSVSWEIGNGIYPVQRNRTIFPTSIVPTGTVDQFRVWYGAADANVASAIIQVHINK